MNSDIKRLHEVAQPIFTTEVYVFCRGKVLMFQRSPLKKKFPGFWSLPGGHIDEGEDPVRAAIREVKEETGVIINKEKIKLKVVAMHQHVDRGEMYVAFAFVAKLDELVELLEEYEEGKAYWVEKEKLMRMENVFPPIKYYFEHVLNNNPGVIYNNSVWENSQLVKVLSETVLVEK